MRKAITLLALISCLLILPNCGDDSEETAVDRRNKYLEEKQSQAQPPVQPEEELIKGPYMMINELEEGTCAYAAAHFAIAIKDVDSTTALAYCSDTMKAVIWALFSKPDQIERMQKAREAGFDIKTVRLVENETDSNLCRACVTARFQEADMEDCSFRLRLENGEWKVYDFGTPADQ